MEFEDKKSSTTNSEDSFALPREYCCLLHTNSTVQCTRDDLFLTNSNFIDSGATINAVSPEFCQRSQLEDRIGDHGVEIPITLANKQEMKVRKRTLRLHLFIDSFDPYVGEFLVLSVPENQDILLGMPWLKAVNPDIDWIEETIKPRQNSCGKYFQQGFYSVTSGETKFITSKQFKRLLRKPEKLD
ncbi:hypothetical protein PHYSODRAFT_482493, partial [Phytophthora sojae]